LWFARAAVSVVWSAFGVPAYLRGLTVANCGCFGISLTQRLSWFTLVQDCLLLLYAALMIRSGLRVRRAAAARPDVQVKPVDQAGDGRTAGPR
jgi:hypothetical protein